jgi:hypothetical protein
LAAADTEASVTFGETIVVGLCTAFAAALLTWTGHFLIAHLQRGNEQTKFFREKLLDRYSEFVAFASADLERARSQAAGMALGGKDQDYVEHAKLDDKRHSIRVELLRLSLQIRCRNSPRLNHSWRSPSRHAGAKAITMNGSIDFS